MRTIFIASISIPDTLKRLGMIGDVDPRPGDVFIPLLAQITKGHIITFEHNRIEYPLALLALLVGQHLFVIAVDEFGVLF